MKMFIEKNDLEIFTLPCEPGAERFAATAHLVVDISDVLPYLNAALQGAIYHKQANALTWKTGIKLSKMEMLKGKKPYKSPSKISKSSS
jgi:ArsR family metal-binding transcriptional regulator